MIQHITNGKKPARNKINIGFYGHSTASWANDPRSFINIVKEEFNANIANIGVPQGSEERVYYDLKKSNRHNDLDWAFIFHGLGGYLFMPGCNRDLNISAVPRKKAKVLWKDEQEGEEHESKKSFEDYFFRPEDKIKDKFKDSDTFIQCMTLYKEFLHDPILHYNRHEGALAMVDQYCKYFNIKTVHMINKDDKPHWFEFSSGVQSTEIEQIMEEYYPEGKHEPWMPNNLTEKGNVIMAEAIIKIINQGVA